MNNSIILLGILIACLTSCATTNQSVKSGSTLSNPLVISTKSRPTSCNITQTEKSESCYITKSDTGNIVISNTKPNCDPKLVCTIPSGSTVTNYVGSTEVNKTVSQ